MDAFAMMRERLVTEAEKSSTAYCDSVMSLGELTVRHATAVAVALLPMTGEYQPDRYRFEHALLRSSGIGDWATALQRITVGPLHPVVAENAGCGGRGGALTQLTEKVKPGDWRHEVVEALHECLRFVGEQVDTPRSPQMLRFFVEFPRLRNKLDAHGAPTSGTKEEISSFLAPALEQLVSNLLILNMPLFGVASSPPDGRPTVVTASTSGDEAGRETVRTHLASMKFRDGLYLGCGSFVSPVVLTHVDSDSRDYFYANGAYRSADSCAEYLSFATGSRRRLRVNEWTKPPDRTRPSVTAGQDALAERGRAFSNAPQLAEGYVARPGIEVQLQEALRNPKRFVITLKGSGGIGKTSLALRVVNTTTEAGDFDLVLWFSARDIDLREDSARLVEPDVLSLDDVARVAMALLRQVGYEDDSTDPQSWLERALCSGTLGRVLWAFDNFETLANPQELFTVVEQAVQEPHKVLITTRHRESVGDFPIEVPGMERDEFEQLVNEECVRIGLDLGVGAASLTELYEETSGHPYITKILLGELRENPRAKFGRVLERRDNLLEALFERTFARLGPDTQHVFLLSCSWRSMIPQLALEVALNGVSGHGIDVEGALDELALLSLVQLSFVEEEAWVVIPLPARIFGSRKLTTDPRRIDLETESRVMQLFGPTKVVSPDQLRQSAQRFWAAAGIHLGTAEWTTWKPLVERVARQVPDLWKQLGQAYASAGMADSAIEALRRSAEARPNDPDAWLELARAHETFDANRAALDAWVHRALLPAATIDDVSFAANKVNGWLARARIRLDPIERRLLIDPLTTVLEQRSGELSARDYSRLGWLYMNVGEKTEALSAAERGIRLDPTSADCARLADRANP